MWLHRNHLVGYDWLEWIIRFWRHWFCGWYLRKIWSVKSSKDFLMHGRILEMDPSMPSCRLILKEACRREGAPKNWWCSSKRYTLQEWSVKRDWIAISQSSCSSPVSDSSDGCPLVNKWLLPKSCRVFNFCMRMPRKKEVGISRMLVTINIFKEGQRDRRQIVSWNLLL